jgi:hypothetical protein
MERFKILMTPLEQEIDVFMGITERKQDKYRQ